MTDKALTLNDVLSQLKIAHVESNRPISDLALDSRKIVGGELFLALPGIDSDGRQYITRAHQKGAAAILVEAHGRHDYLSEFAAIDIPIVFVQGLKHCVGMLASYFYQSFAEKIQVVGITGTNGKTSCCWFLAKLLSGIGVRCAIMGTLGKGMPGILEPMLNTTPDVISAHQFIASLAKKECSSLAMEVSSHGLEQGRVEGIQFDVGVFTNLSRDHLDSHGSMDEYAAAKSLLFSSASLTHAVINLDDPYAAMMLSACKKGVNVITWSQLNSAATIYATDVKLLAEGITAVIHSPWGTFEIKTALMGRFNLENVLTVMAILGVQGYDLGRFIPLVSSLMTVPGRMQRLGGGTQPLVIIDYAHTPDALRGTLSALLEHGAKKLICVFGCGGDRDKGKRPLMTSAAVEIADVVILTSDNPRTEEPEAIIEDALKGIDGRAKKKIRVMVNRADAIAEAIANAGVNDILVVAGKGHETYQEVNGVRHPFDDCDHACNALKIWSKA